MPKLVFILALFAACISCHTNGVDEPEAPREPLPKDQIASNLSVTGSADAELLLEDWRPVKFAYTVDGKTIEDVEDIFEPLVKMIDTEKLWFVQDYYDFKIPFDCSISGNLIELTENSSMKYEFTIPNGTILQPDGSRLLVSPAIVYYPNGSPFSLISGLPVSERLADGTLLLSDSTLLQPNGMRWLTNGLRFYRKDSLVYSALFNAYSFVVRCNELIIFFTGFDDRNLLILKKSTWYSEPVMPGLETHPKWDEREVKPPLFEPKIDHTLIGIWNCQAFAYSAELKNIREIWFGSVVIPDTTSIFYYNLLDYVGVMSLSGNMINISRFNRVFPGPLGPYGYIERITVLALSNASRYEINEDILMIFFEQPDFGNFFKDKNVLILKKRASCQN